MESNLSIIFLYILLLLNSAKLESTNNKNHLDNNYLIKNENHIVSYECLEKDIKFKFDFIGDETNELNGSWPKIDMYRIWVDFNNNNKIDSLIDRNFSPIKFKSDYLVCKSLMLSKIKLKPCIIDTDAVCFKEFTKTDNSKSRHVYFEMIIPKKELSQSNKVSVYFEFFDGNGKKFSYPSNSPLFNDTYLINCDLKS
ncbi:MAG: hypothetical protein ACQETL_17750 [Bacteroidota bacterium]